MWLAEVLDRLSAGQERIASLCNKMPLCDKEEEMINHLLLSCVFSQQAWFIILQRLGQQALAPQIGELSFDDWWEQSSKRLEGQDR